MITKPICVVLSLLSLATEASPFKLSCSSSNVQGRTIFRLNPKPDSHCILHWDTAGGQPIASGTKFNDALVEASSHDKIVLKKCIPTLRCSVDCDSSNGLPMQNFDADCSADCSEREFKPVSVPPSATSQNKAHNYSDNSRVDTGSQTHGALPLYAVILLGCLGVIAVVIAVGILWWKVCGTHACICRRRERVPMDV